MQSSPVAGFIGIASRISLGTLMGASKRMELPKEKQRRAKAELMEQKMDRLRRGRLISCELERMPEIGLYEVAEEYQLTPLRRQCPQF